MCDDKHFVVFFKLNKKLKVIEYICQFLKRLFLYYVGQKIIVYYLYSNLLQRSIMLKIDVYLWLTT